MTNININRPKIDLNDLIKLSHLEILNNLIKRSAEDVNKLEDFNIEKVADIISEHYKNLFCADFMSRYKKTLENFENLIKQP